MLCRWVICGFMVFVFDLVVVNSNFMLIND